MATIEDLSQCCYLPVPSENLLAVGWLSRESVFERGAVDPEFYEKLKVLCSEPWQPVVAAGKHYCELCQFEPPGFSSNLFVPYAGRVYVAPVAVVHYIAAHWYRPPVVFVRAVMECPSMNSMGYKKALLLNGGRDLVKAAFARP
jgi:hypothetical protein